jgi:SAM-dependent methyltransferase
MAEKRNNKESPICYVKGSVFDIHCGQQFDLVSVQHVVCYSHNVKQMEKFIEAAARSLRPGGRFVGIDDNPDFEMDDTIGKYGIEIKKP